jgi:Ca-activated chloride channel family protein
MKPDENNLEKNISRLVKLTGDSSNPGKVFADSLIDNAIGKLTKSAADQKRDERNKPMKTKWLKIFAYAASILIVCSVVIGLTVPHLGRVRQQSLTSKNNAPVMALVESKPAATDQYAKEAPINSVQRQQGALDSLEVKNKVAGDKTAGVRREEAKYNSYSQETPIVPVQRQQSVLDGLGVTNKVAGDTTAGVMQPETSYKLYSQETPMDYVHRGLPEVQSKELGEMRLGTDYAFSKRQVVSYRDARDAFSGVCPRPVEPGPRGYPMAHGGTTPPNGEDVDGNFFKNYGVNPFIDTEDDHLSTFATDVDTGSYTVVRGYLLDGHIPPQDAVRVEEFVNYFKYNYPAPQEDVFAVYAEAAPWKFGPARKNSFLLRLGLKAKQISEENRKPAVLTFVIDVSGSMGREDRLGLVKKCLRMLVERLKEQDRIGIAVYGSRGRKLMSHKGLDEKDEILAAIESLQAGGSTYAEEGIRIGYEMAEKAYKKGHINRVILCSDGVANVGQTGADDILEVIKQKADKGITLSAIGFGMGNYNDVLMERLGDKGNGYYVYIDTIAEAKRIFEDNLTGALQVVARDVKVQVDFNPKVVRSYRLIGYENRDVPDEKFRDDKYDGGEVGAGHSVTALYELKLWPDKDGTVATTHVRYKDADTYEVTEFKNSIATKDLNKNFEDSSSNFRLAATVTEFAEILRKSYWAKDATLDSVLEHAQQLGRKFKNDADVIELADLISKAKQLMKKADSDVTEAEEAEGTTAEP